jgi:hypothetical protein
VNAPQSNEDVPQAADRFDRIVKHMQEFVFPCVVSAGDGTISTNGISKRELFAAMAMQGILSNPKTEGCPADHAQRALLNADTLLSALEQNRG